MSQVFGNVKFYLAPSIPPEKQRALSSCLKANGAVEVSLDKASHVITNSNAFDGWQTVGPNVDVVSVRVSIVKHASES